MKITIAPLPSEFEAEDSFSEFIDSCFPPGTVVRVSADGVVWDGTVDAVEQGADTRVLIQTAGTPDVRSLKYTNGADLGMAVRDVDGAWLWFPPTTRGGGLGASVLRDVASILTTLNDMED